MMRDGESWEQSTPELLTNVSESGSWRSPAAHEPGISIGRLETRTGEPVGSMCRHYDKHTGRMAQIGLTQQVQAKIFPTPSTKGLDGGSNSRKAAKERGMWPTPCASEARQGLQIRREGKKGSQQSLSTAVVFATPQARDFRTGSKDRWENPERSRNLNDQIGGQLNPSWVAWLMGWPVGWTDCAASATDRFRQWCRSHGISYDNKEL